MGKSYKKNAIVKISGWARRFYWSIVRSRNKQELKQNKDLSNPKTIINDWDYVDYTSNCIKKDNCYCMREYGYKKCIKK
jgi:uncharacterized protein YchJ